MGFDLGHEAAKAILEKANYGFDFDGIVNLEKKSTGQWCFNGNPIDNVVGNMVGTFDGMVAVSIKIAPINVGMKMSDTDQAPIPSPTPG